MRTTYSKIHKNMDCPICGKPLIEHEKSDTVACSNSKCRFNKVDIFGYTEDDYDERGFPYGITIDDVIER